jgi:predicted PurR-regulated permease PerM
MQGNFKISNPFQIGLLGGLGVLSALLLGGVIASIANVLAYVAGAIFIALGFEPVVVRLEKFGMRRRWAIITVMASLLAVLAVLISAVLPPLASQAARFIKSAPVVMQTLNDIPLVANLDRQFDGAISNALSNAGEFLANTANWPSMVGGLLQVGISIFNGFFGAIIVLILTLYFMASLDGFKRWTYSLVPSSRREKFASIAEQISESVGRYVMGQVSIGVIQSIVVFILLSVLGVPYALVISAFAFLLGLIPLVGTITAAVIASLVALSVSPNTAIIVAVFYLVYMQVEAYIISPRIMSRAVQVPGAVVVIGALAGGAILGVLGALVAIPVAASIMLILRQVVIPRQESL